MNKQNELVKFFKGKIVSGHFYKMSTKDKRYFHGVLKFETRDTPDLITVYDFQKKQYRRFRLDQGSIKLKSGNQLFSYNKKSGITFKTRSV